MADGKLIGAADLDLRRQPSDEAAARSTCAPRAKSPTARRSARRMTRTENNISGAAKLLGISRPTLYDLMKQYQLQA